QDDAQGDAKAVVEPPRNEIRHHPGDDGAVQRVTGGKGKRVLVRWYGVAKWRPRPADDRLADSGEGERPATAMIMRISGVRERHRHTINSVMAPAIRVMPSAPPKCVNPVHRWLASGVRQAMTWLRAG